MLQKERKKILKVILLLILFITTNSFNVYGSFEEGNLRKILILASYDIDNQWEVSVIKGFKKSLSYGEVIKVEFLDSKASESDIYGESLINLLNIKYKNDDFDCILALDDEAFNLVRKNIFNENLFLYKKPTVFVGVNSYVALSVEENRYMTGLMEHQDNSLMINTILSENKKIDDIYVLLDKSIYSKTIKENINRLTTLSERPFNAHIIEESYLQKVIEKLNGINKKSSALYLCGTYMDENGINLSSEFTVNTIKDVTKAPLYTKLIPYVESGAIGGVINDGEKLGMTALSLLDKFLEQFNESGIVPIYSTYNTSIFNYKVMREYNINPLKLPNNTIYINKGPFGILLPTYMVITIWSLVGITFIIIIFTIYLNYVNKKKAQENRLLFVESEERNKVKTDFIITLSHELRTPLNIIISSSNLMGEYINNKQFDIYFFYEKLKFITNNANRLLRYVNNIIDSSKLEIGYMSIEFDNLNIVYVIEETTMAVVDIAKKYNLEVIFNTEEEEIITAIDEEKICRVLLILLSNAIKFSREKGIIYVDIKREEDTVVIKIIDNGIGIDKNIQEKIFERFKRVQSVSNLNVDKEGSGIGLYIAKGFVKLHNGEIKVESTINKGSTFIITLPIAIVENDKKINKFTKEDLEQIVKIELSDI